jgi:hypothetical protein
MWGLISVRCPVSIFAFRAKWKEELVCTGPGGSFVLELPMGILTAYLPTEEAFERKAPSWAQCLWPQLKDELSQWCVANKAQLVIDPTAGVY